MKDLRMVKIKIDLHFNAISHHVTNQFTRVHYTVHVTHTPSTFTTIFVILWKNKERKIIKIKWMIFENNNEVKYYIQMSPGIYFSFVLTRTFFPHFFQYQKQYINFFYLFLHSAILSHFIYLWAQGTYYVGHGNKSFKKEFLDNCSFTHVFD